MLIVPLRSTIYFINIFHKCLIFLAWNCHFYHTLIKRYLIDWDTMNIEI